jgi:hypothetical protein
MESFREALFQVPTVLITFVYFIFIFVLNWAGYRVRKKIHERNRDRDTSFGAAEGSLLGLMALLLAFTFNLANTKYESRRQVIIDEANLLNTAILRHQLYNDSVKQILIPDLRRYLESRISYYDAGDAPAKIKAALDDGNRAFNAIWNRTAQLRNVAEDGSRAEQMIPVLISLDNMAINREAGRVALIPTLVILILLLLVFASSFLMGFGTKPGNRNPTAAFGFAFMTTVVLFLIMELNRPRQGFINLQNAEQRIVNLRKSFQ